MLGKKGNIDALTKFIKTFEETYGMKQKAENREKRDKSQMKNYKTEAQRSGSKL